MMKQFFYRGLFIIILPIIAAEKTPTRTIPSLVDLSAANLSVPQVAQLIVEGKATLNQLPLPLQQKVSEYQEKVDEFVRAAKGAQSFEKEVKNFLDNGINVNARSSRNGNTALIAASIAAHESVIDALLQAKANINLKNNDGANALMMAVESGSTFIVEKLIKAGADLNAGNKLGRTPLMLAIKTKKQDREEMVKVILKAGALIDIPDNEGMTALMHAANLINYYYSDRLVSILLPYHPKLDLQATFNGWTALMFAAAQGGRKAVESLLNEGAKYTTIDNKGKDAIRIAKENANDHIAKLISDFIAKDKTEKM